MGAYVTAAGSSVTLSAKGGWVADWDWFEEATTCIDARPIDAILDECRVIVTVHCACCGEATVIATPPTPAGDKT